VAHETPYNLAKHELILSWDQICAAVPVTTPAGPCAEAPRLLSKGRDFFRADAESAILVVSQWIASRTLTDETIRWPATWWEAIKERWLPEWAKRWWPVVYKVRRLRAKDLYPNIKRIPGEPVARVAWIDECGETA